MPADLHCHSIYSDGTTKPETMIKTAENIGLSAIAITDHDDFIAHKNLFDDILNSNIRVIKGAEISSVDPYNNRKVHILCYLPKDESVFDDILAATRINRTQEVQNCMEIISNYYPINLDMLKEFRSPYTSYFKQNIMQLLMELGYSNSVFNDLFSKFFNQKTGLIKFKIKYPTVYTVLDAIKQARGIAVMAHPAYYDSFELLQKLCKEKLLDGVEIEHPRQTDEDKKFLHSIADEYNLIKTGGTDFHGYNTTPVCPIGFCQTEDSELEKLLELSYKK